MTHVWYASYGSNMSAGRFATYLQGGRPPGATREYPGARDPAPPIADTGLTVSGSIFFGWESRTWGGGVAFFDGSGREAVLLRAYRITREQFEDVAAQEMHRAPGTGFQPGAGRYETLAEVGELGGEPVLTFTCAPASRPQVNPPSAAYLRTVATGLREAHGLAAAEIADYLARWEGVAGRWSPGDLARLDQPSPE